jgi:hypothetical protein
MATSDNKTVVRQQWYEELWNRWNVNAADQLFTSDYQLHIAGTH